MTSDSQLQSDVLSELRWEPSVNAAHIGVAVNGNVVTLTGQVDYYMEKMAAEQAAKRVYGVQAVVNNIEVELPDSSRRTDQDIAAAATNALEWDAWVPEGIKATVDDGWVTLEGSVDWQYQKDAAERCVRNLTGVAGVTNSISIKSKPSASGIKDKIEDAFRRSADLDARRIGVDAYDGKVTLSGTVSSWSERDEAVSAAWAAPGVTAVEDELTIVP